MINSSFWLNKKVFLTGHSGFKGSWLALWLSSMGAKVYGYSLKPYTDPCLFNKIKISDFIESSTIGDIRNYNNILSNTKKIDPDIVFHLAAQPLVRYSYNYPLETFSTNIIGTANILEASRACNNIKSIIIVTSDKCYENKDENISYVENNPMGGHDPYSSSKGCAELISKAYYNSFFLNQGVGIATVRAGNIFGGGDWSDDRLIPDAVRAISNSKKLIIRNPNSIRPWQYIHDPLNGYLLLAEKLYFSADEFSGPWNFGPHNNNEDLTVNNLLNIFKLSLKNHNLEIQTFKNDNNLYEAKILKLNSSKSNKLLNWYPKLNINEGINQTALWYENYLHNKDMISFSID